MEPKADSPLIVAMKQRFGMLDPEPEASRAQPDPEGTAAPPKASLRADLVADMRRRHGLEN